MKTLRCPFCKHEANVYNMHWSEMQCSHCRAMVELADWTPSEVEMLKIQVQELRHLLFLAITPLEAYAESMGRMTSNSKVLAEDMLILIRAELAKWD